MSGKVVHWETLSFWKTFLSDLPSFPSPCPFPHPKRRKMRLGLGMSQRLEIEKEHNFIILKINFIFKNCI